LRLGNWWKLATLSLDLRQEKLKSCRIELEGPLDARQKHTQDDECNPTQSEDGSHRRPIAEQRGQPDEYR
jgi:hypothetical protein